ncbi:MAG: class I SAM-dependent methyltransferase, partial [Planctomycetota bacterium]
MPVEMQDSDSNARSPSPPSEVRPPPVEPPVRPLREAGAEGLLAVGGAQRQEPTVDREREREKWDAVYQDFDATVAESDAVEQFNAQFAELVCELLPKGGRVLEAGCGGASQSLALARTGRFDVAVMDFSENALKAAQARFAQAQLPATFELGDVYEPGEPQYDLVFNAGVLEHYTLKQQAAFLRGMATRSKRYVLALAPNRLCYWYWLWRIQKTGVHEWPYGKEAPVADLSEAFTAAGLHFQGQAFVGQ